MGSNIVPSSHRDSAALTAKAKRRSAAAQFGGLNLCQGSSELAMRS